MHKVLLRIDKDLYDQIQRWCYKQKSEGRQMSFQQFVTDCIQIGVNGNNIKGGEDDKSRNTNEDVSKDEPA